MNSHYVTFLQAFYSSTKFTKKKGGRGDRRLLICLETTNCQAAQDGWATVPFFAESSDTYVRLFAIDWSIVSLNDLSFKC